MNPDEKLTPEQMLRMLDGRMPTKDLDNLKFILNLENLGPELAAEWLMIQDPDDAIYALELLKSCTEVIKDQIRDLEDDHQDLDLTEANLIINRIKGL